MSAAKLPDVRWAKSREAPERPDLVPTALLGMPLLAVGGGCLTPALGWWALPVAGLPLALLVVLAVWSTGSSS